MAPNHVIFHFLFFLSSALPAAELAAAVCQAKALHKQSLAMLFGRAVNQSFQCTQSVMQAIPRLSSVSHLL